MHEAGRVPGFTWFDRLHAYVYGRWTYLYIAIGVGEHPIARVLGPVVRALRPRRRPESQLRPTSADRYHGKVVPLETARRLVRVMEPVTVADLERVIPYPVARSLILRQPDHVVALECPCRTARPDPCRPLDVCLVVGEPFASFVAEHHPRRSRWITPQEPEAILEAEHRRGHVQHAFFKDAMLGRFYAICNCCPCCCGAMQAQRSGTPMLASSGYRAVLEPSACAACASCADACPFGAIEVGDGQPRFLGQACMGCGVCVSRCPSGALRLVPAPERGVPLDLETILSGQAWPAPQASPPSDRAVSPIC
jgi:ferredoxin